MRAIHVPCSSTLSHSLSEFWVTVDALHEIFSQGLNPCPSRQRTISQPVLVLSSSWGLVTRLASVIFGEMTRWRGLSLVKVSDSVAVHIFAVFQCYFHTVASQCFIWVLFGELGNVGRCLIPHPKLNVWLLLTPLIAELTNERTVLYTLMACAGTTLPYLYLCFCYWKCQVGRISQVTTGVWEPR